MKVLVKEYKDFDEKVKKIDEGFNIDIQYWVLYGKPSVRKIYRKGDEFIELSIYYNYKKNLISKISKNKVVSESDNCMMSTEIQRIKEEFTQVKQASKKNILEKMKELKNIKLESYI